MLTIDVISDVICPWCFIGKRRLEKALGGRPATVRWHPFQLNPDDRIDQSTVDFLRRVEQEQDVRLPVALTRLLRCEGAARAVMDSHSNNPSLLDFDASQWTVRRGMREQNLSGDCALLIMTPHQGDHEWVGVFDDGDEDARVYVRWDGEEGESWLLTAPTVAMFFWDLAQTGLIWFQDTNFDGGKPVRRTDIGLALEA